MTRKQEAMIKQQVELEQAKAHNLAAQTQPGGAYMPSTYTVELSSEKLDSTKDGTEWYSVAETISVLAQSAVSLCHGSGFTITVTKEEQTT